MQSIHLKNNEHLTATAFPKANDGQIGAITNTPPTWTSTNIAVVTVSPALDGMSAEITAVGLIGTAQINVSAQGAVQGFPGPGFTSSFEVVIDPDKADHFDFTFGSPSPNVP